MTKNEVVLFVVISTQFWFTSHFQISPDYGPVLRRARVDGDIFSTVGKIFVILKNGNNFTTSKHAAENLLIHKFIRNVKEIYNDQYEEIYNISRAPNYDDKTKYIILVISKTVQRIIKKEWKNYNKSKEIMRTVFSGVLDDGNVRDEEHRGGAMFDFVRFERIFTRGAQLTSAMIVANLLFENSNQLFARASSRPQVERDVEAWEPSGAATRRLFGGRASSVAEFPFVCSVHVGGQFGCAGAILSKRAVITAASCLWRFHSERRLPRVPVSARVGSDFTGAAGLLVPVVRMFFHARFDVTSLSNNLVILKLQERLTFGDGVRKIKYDTEAAQLPENVENVFVLGWGASNMSLRPISNQRNFQVTKYEGVVYRDSTLSSATEKVYNLESCQEAYSRFYVKDRHFCTGLVDRGSGACSNDLGGPAVVGSVLVGLISFGPAHCGRRDEPTVYTKLGFYAEWITNVTNQITVRKSPKKLRKQQINNEVDFDSIKQLAGELQEVIRTKSSATAGQTKLKPRCQHSEEERGLINSTHNTAILGPEEEKDPELTESNNKITTGRLSKFELKKPKVKRFKKSSKKMPKDFKLTIPSLMSPSTEVKTKNIELEMAYDSSDTKSSNANIFSTEFEDEYSSETEGLPLPLDDGDGPLSGADDKDYP